MIRPGSTRNSHLRQGSDGGAPISTPRGGNKTSNEYFMKLSQSDNLSKNRALHKKAEGGLISKRLAAEVDKIEEEG